MPTGYRLYSGGHILAEVNMKKTIKRILDITSTLVAAVIVAVLLLAVSACGQPKNEPPAEVTVQKIEVTKLPAQTDYMTG